MIASVNFFVLKPYFLVTRFSRLKIMHADFSHVVKATLAFMLLVSTKVKLFKCGGNGSTPSAGKLSNHSASQI